MVVTEIILNLAWMLLCILALSVQVWRDGLRSGMRNGTLRLRRTLSVFIAALALFPVISASDDRIRLADLSAPASQQTAFTSGQMNNWLQSAPLEDPEHGQTPEPVVPIVIVCLFLIVLREFAALPRWFSVSAFGRAPPQMA